jgi:hypothetical protein
MGDLKEIKIVLDWAKSNVDKSIGSKVSNPNQYLEATQTYDKVKAKYDEVCKEWIFKNL